MLQPWLQKLLCESMCRIAVHEIAETVPHWPLNEAVMFRVLITDREVFPR